MNEQKDTFSRRAFLQRMTLITGAGTLFIALLPDAGGRAAASADGADTLSCTDVSGLTEQQIQTRKAVKYVDDSPHTDKRCNNCRFFKAPPDGKECGQCEIIPGPIHPKGYCTAWVAAAG